LSSCYELDTATVAATRTVDICASVAAARAGNASADTLAVGMAELTQRGAFSTAELNAISAGQVFIGMTEDAMICAVGGTFYGVNTTTTAFGRSTQFVVGDGKYVLRSYIYTDDGVVTAIQN
jgi:2-keto-3-deoxy-galactonokinase